MCGRVFLPTRGEGGDKEFALFGESCRWELKARLVVRAFGFTAKVNENITSWRPELC